MIDREPQFDPSAGLPEVKEGWQPESEMTDIQERALKVVKADIEAGKRTSQSDKARREEAYKLYRDLNDADNERPGRSKVKSSDVMDMVEWLMPSLMKAFFGTHNCISVDPIGAEDAKKAELLQKLLNWQFVDKGNGFTVGHEWMQASLIYGLVAAKITWQDIYVSKGFAFPQLLEPQFEELRNDPLVDSLTVEGVETVVQPTPNPIQMASQQIGQPLNNPMGQPANQQQQFEPSPDYYQALSRETQPMSPFQQLMRIGSGMQQNQQNMTLQPQMLEAFRVYENVKGEQRIKIYSGPLVEPIPPEDFLYDAEARTMSEARFAIHRVRRTATYLRKKEKEGVYCNVEEALSKESASKYNINKDEEDGEKLDRARYKEDYTNNYTIRDEQEARRKYSVYEWWGLLDPDDSGIAEPYLVVVCNDTVIRMEKNPYAHGEPPFEVMRPLLDIFSMRGISVVDLVGEYQKTKTAIIRQVLDNISWQNNQMWAVDENAGVDIDSLKNPRPGGIVLMDNLAGFKQIGPAPLDSSAMMLLETIQGQLEQRTGITRYNQGLDASSLNKTATGISQILNAGSQRIELIARVMSETGWRRLYKKMLQLDQQFIDQKIVIRVYGQPLEISPDDLAGNFDVSVDIGGATNKEQQEVQQMMTMLNYAPTLMKMGVMRPENIYEMCKKILTTWGISEFEKYISSPQEAQKLAMLIQGIDQLGAMIQQGQVPQPQQLVQAVTQARQVLVQLLGQDVAQQGNQDNRQKQVEPEKMAKDNAAAMKAKEGNFISYANGTSAGGIGEEQ